MEFEIVKGEGTPDSYTASFKMFENRQGRVYDHSDNWENLKGLIGRDDAEAQKYGYEDMYCYYQQINKRGLAGIKGKRMPNPQRKPRRFSRET